MGANFRHVYSSFISLVHSQAVIPGIGYIDCRQNHSKNGRFDHVLDKVLFTWHYLLNKDVDLVKDIVENIRALREAEREARKAKDDVEKWKEAQQANKKMDAIEKTKRKK